MPLGLGIDTGGTYTDAVLVDLDSKKVFASVKTLTTREDLSLGIREAIVSLLDQTRRQQLEFDIDVVGLSTTLATNAIVEGYGGQVCLLLIGYNQEVIAKHGLHRELLSDCVVFIPGGYDLQGNESCRFNEGAVRQAVRRNRDQVDAFAISSFFGTRNPSHEIGAREIVEELCDLPVTCGHELTTRLNSVLRAQTAVINAALIPLLRSLIVSVRNTLSSLKIMAPLLVVKGDGSLLKAEQAIQRPVETILSGPAASILGAHCLSGQNDGWIVDMGGTTTDIGRLVKGQVETNMLGATVGNKKTMVQAADIYTTGLGGDSQVQVENANLIDIGPRRVIPLCMLAAKHPHILKTLHFQKQAYNDNPLAGQFAVFWRNPKHHLSASDQVLLDRIKAEPLPILASGREGLVISRRLEIFEKLYLTQRGGFTPTDALHVLGRLSLWNSEASVLGAGMLAKRAGLSAESFCRIVVQRVCEKVGTAIVTKIISNSVGFPDWENERTATFLLAHALRADSSPELDCTFTLRRPLVAIGAPAGAYMHRVSEILNTRLIIPPHAEVANAVGAVVGSITIRLRVLITPLEGGNIFRAHLPNGIKDFPDLEEAVRFTKEHVSGFLEVVSRDAGAEKVTMQIERDDRVIEGIYLNTELLFKAAGRPAGASRHLPK
jgi:N-methylhydantoinase A/oxoprolinase/acetone carboxylase beta subunit